MYQFYKVFMYIKILPNMVMHMGIPYFFKLCHTLAVQLTLFDYKHSKI